MKPSKVAFVTGAGRGIGRAVALGLAEQGYAVALLARSSDELASTKQEILARSGSAAGMAFACDVAKPAAIRDAFHTVIEQWGRVDVLVNNAGQYTPGTLELSDAAFSTLIDVNLKGAFYAAREAAAVMKQQGSGWIINISSLCGVHGFAGLGGYCASKFALNGLSESLYRELAPYGIRVCSICPSWTNTKMARGSEVPPEAMIQPNDIQKAISFLLSLSGGASVREMVIDCTSTIA